MIKADLILPSGATVTIEGPEEEVKRLLDFYGGVEQTTTANRQKILKKSPKASSAKKPEAPKTAPADIARIVSLIKSCPEADSIERTILDHGRETDRVLLPLYVIHQHLDNRFGLTTVEISEVLSQLDKKAHVTRQNSLRALKHSSASKYVVTDIVRKAGTKPHYSINARGVKYLQDVISRA